MGSIIAELVDTGEQRDALGRRRTPSERRVQLVQAFKRSGMTMASFAGREGVNYTTFAGWVQLSRCQRKDRKPSFARVHLPAAVAAASLEAQLVDSTVLHGARVVSMRQTSRSDP